jgi:DNA-binding transcriptional ArsR family regulator
MVSSSLRFVTTYQVDGWTALGDPSRRGIFERLVQQPLSVADLARELPISRPAVSQHLKVLRQARLVDVDQRGTRRIYRVDPTGLEPLRRDLDRFWATTLQNFKQLAEQADPAGDKPAEEEE